MKKVVSPPRTSRPTVERRAVTWKYRSRPFFGRMVGPALRRAAGASGPVGAPTAVLPVRAGTRTGRDLLGIGGPLGTAPATGRARWLPGGPPGVVGCERRQRATRTDPAGSHRRSDRVSSA
ncbi:hypothetical protein GCM10028783_35090 [Modestobacter muralis]